MTITMNAKIDGEGQVAIPPDIREQLGLLPGTEVQLEVVGDALQHSVVENDPRWQMLSASGVIQAKWDGVGLKLTREWTPAIEEQSQQG